MRGTGQGLGRKAPACHGLVPGAVLVPLEARIAVILVEHDHAAGRQQRQHMLEHAGRRFVEVAVHVNQRETRAVGDERGQRVGEQADVQAHVVAVKPGRRAAEMPLGQERPPVLGQAVEAVEAVNLAAGHRLGQHGKAFAARDAELGCDSVDAVHRPCGMAQHVEPVVHRPRGLELGPPEPVGIDDRPDDLVQPIALAAIEESGGDQSRAQAKSPAGDHAGRPQPSAASARQRRRRKRRSTG